jgi:hypothetical protein
MFSLNSKWCLITFRGSKKSLKIKNHQKSDEKWWKSDQKSWKSDQKSWKNDEKRLKNAIFLRHDEYIMVFFSFFQKWLRTLLLKVKEETTSIKNSAKSSISVWCRLYSAKSSISVW